MATHPLQYILVAAALGLCAGAGAAQPVQVEPFQLEAGVSWDDNLTRASDAPDRLSDRQLSLALSRSISVPFTPHVRGVFRGTIGADKLARYEGLDRLVAGVDAQLQYRASSAFHAPTFSVFANVQREEFRSSQRTGTRTAAGASVRQSWTDRIDAFAAVSWSRRDAHDSTFDQRERGVRFHIDYSLGRLGTLYAGAEHRRGDVVSTAPGYDLEYSEPSKAHSIDRAFGPGWWAYRFDGRTTLWNVGWSLPLAADHAVDVSWRRARSSVPIPHETIHYRSDLVSLTYLLRF